MKTFEFATKEDYALLNERLESEEYSELGQFRIRFAIVMVTTSDKAGVVLPSFKTLPYNVKLNSAKDRLLKNVDVEIQIDNDYWMNDCREENDKKAIIDGALEQLEICTKKDDVVMNDDGTVKLKLVKPDLVYEGFLAIAERYEGNSAEVKKMRELKGEFGDIAI